MGHFGKDARLIRRSDFHLDITNDANIPVTLYASKDVPVEREGVTQLLDFSTIASDFRAIERAQHTNTIEPYWDNQTPGQLQKIVLTPDFHKGGSGIPVGTVAKTQHIVIPQAVGNDICCGMRLIVTSLTRRDLIDLQDKLEPLLRGIFFEGKRHIALSPRQREAILRGGLKGLFETRHDNQAHGLWQHYDAQQQLKDLAHVHKQGGLETNDTFAFDDYIQSSGQKQGYDAQIGSVGGGNHFVEIQTIDEIMDGQTAHAWGLSMDQVTIMVHTGSVGLGHRVGRHFTDVARSIYPKQWPHPAHGFFGLPTTGPHAHLAKQYLSAMHNAANFAFANRMFLGLMVIRAMREATQKTVDHTLLYDAPHNLIWPGEDDTYVHRKGACPAYGLKDEVAPFCYTGPPVIIPGSMGASSFVLAGHGKESALCSACHGAGRSISRGRARQMTQADFDQEVAPLKVITPIDPNAASLRGRRDILSKHRDRLAEESPHAYKPITPVVESIEGADIARRVVRLWPWMTIKG